MDDNDQQPDPEMHKRLDAAFADDILDPMRTSVEGALAQIDDAVNKARELAERAVVENAPNLLMAARVDERDALACGLRDVLAECRNPSVDSHTAADLLASFIQEHDRQTDALREQCGNDRADAMSLDVEGKGVAEAGRGGSRRSDFSETMGRDLAGRALRGVSEATARDWNNLGR